MTDNLKERQEAGERVEKKVLAWLLEFDPANRMAIRDAKAVAAAARNIAFNEFSEI